ncbi:hypothetical protein C9374_014576 [Naegleria lovaniensis]|uniref:Cell cycle checkpoint control protein n=1 Tax=Naegleria lovaniensis TaxID=51637 RepID=A0AA88GVH6_NAELO|nr:uncharacterized protein C9374_014576 [Naegleria lovaniensis]KAG2389176.1 hypothetical protein C9374_014576 [Naegleria lovaniensis]
MEVGISNRQNIKLFAHIINCLAKVGEEVAFEVAVNSVSLTTINAGKSSFLHFVLAHSFFDRWAVIANAPKKFKLTLKNIVHVFKSANHLEQLKIVVDKNKSKVVFDSLGLSQVQKIYEIYFTTCDVSVPADGFKPSFEFVVNAAYISNLLTPFGKHSGDITLRLGKRIILTTSQQQSASPQQNPQQGADGGNPQSDLVQPSFTQYYIHMSSYNERNVPEKLSGVQTRLVVDTVNLESFHIIDQNNDVEQIHGDERVVRPSPPLSSNQAVLNTEAELSFSFKDLKALISFCEVAEYNMSFALSHLKQQPVVITSCSLSKDLQVTLMMATNDVDDNNDSSTTETSITSAPTRKPSQQQTTSNENQMMDDQELSSFSTPPKQQQPKRKRVDLEDSSILESRLATSVGSSSISSGKSLHNRFLNEDIEPGVMDNSFGLNGVNERYIELFPHSSSSLSTPPNRGQNSGTGMEDEENEVIAQRHISTNASNEFGDDDEEEEMVQATPSPKRKK